MGREGLGNYQVLSSSLFCSFRSEQRQGRGELLFGFSSFSFFFSLSLAAESIIFFFPVIGLGPVVVRPPFIYLLVARQSSDPVSCTHTQNKHPFGYSITRKGCWGGRVGQWVGMYGACTIQHKQNFFLVTFMPAAYMILVTLIMNPGGVGETEQIGEGNGGALKGSGGVLIVVL
ncbi:hypothetical protein QBC41DRAFT_105391 [Cercophora samala]|uniref:Uncharacterized protein n=1 Tax=Cercophora samala TaxID=330535 RepID=A0AA40DDE9_9PEZI|nr:hypothetical protein QBC41DRAFT_105391 [Cercophora samala]